MNRLQAAIRERFGTPEKALEALGLPADLLAADGKTSPGPLTNALKRNSDMKLSATALLAHSALVGFLAPMLAADAAIDLRPAVEGVTKKNLGAKKADIWAKAKTIAKPFLANDEAGPDDVAMRILDMIDKQGAAEPATAEPAEEVIDEGTGSQPAAQTEPSSAAAPPAAGAGGEADPEAPEGTEDGEPDPEVLKALTEKLGGDAEMARACYDIMHGGAKDEVVAPEKTEVPAKTAPPAGDKRKAKDEEPHMQPGGAMDSKIKLAVDQAKADMREEARQAQIARTFVRPWVGEVSVAFDTAEDIYKAALESMGVSTKGLHKSAYRAVLERLPRSGKVLATDELPGKGKGGKKASAAESFPGARRITVMG